MHLLANKWKVINFSFFKFLSPIQVHTVPISYEFPYINFYYQGIYLWLKFNKYPFLLATFSILECSPLGLGSIFTSALGILILIKI